MICIAVPVKAMEAWLLEWASLVRIRKPTNPRKLDRKRAKEILWGSATPREADVRDRCGVLFDELTDEHLEALAAKQPSFKHFKACVESLGDL